MPHLSARPARPAPQSGISPPGHHPPTPAISQGVLLALLADARLPTGAHTQSSGLEPALRAGLRPDQVPAYIAARLGTATRVEAATAVVARHAALGAAQDVATTADTLAAVGRAWAARTPSAAIRQSSERLGRGYLRLVRRLWADHPAVAALDAVDLWRERCPGAGVDGSHPHPRRSPPRAVVLGVTAACAGLDALGVARLVGYDDVQTVAAACLKLAPVDPVVTTGWVLAAAPAVDALAHELARLTHPADIPAAGAPQTEEWAEAHAVATERLFSA
jgi:urease accessory protein